MNKKGFTLIELLAVIVILSIIALIAIPIILNIINKVEEGSLSAIKNNMEKAAELYVFNHLDEFNLREGEKEYIQLSQLEGIYLKKVKNPRGTGECEGYVKVENINSNLEYNAYLDCGNGQNLLVDSSYVNYGGNYLDSFASIKKTGDGGYIVVGSSNSTTYSGNTTKGSTVSDDGIIVKYNSDGIEEWSRNFGGSGNDRFYDVIETDDGYVLVGSTTSKDGDLSDLSTGDHNSLLVKYNKQGTLLTKKILFSRDGTSGSIARKILYLDGYYYITGNSRNVSGQNANLMYLAVYDNNFNQLSANTYGGTRASRLLSMFVNSNNNIVIAGYSSSINSEMSDIKIGPEGISDAVFFEINSNTKNIVSKGSFGGTNGDDYITDIIEVDDGYIVIGYGESTDHHMEGNKGRTDAFVAKYSKTPGTNGILPMLWKKIIGGSNEDQFRRIIKISDNLIIIGESNSIDGDFDGITKAGNQYYDGLIIKMDLSGNILDKKTYGGSKSDFFTDIIYDGGKLVVVGRTFSTDGNIEPFNLGNSDAIMANFDINLNPINNFQLKTLLKSKPKEIVKNYGMSIPLPVDKDNLKLYTTNDTTKDLGGWCKTGSVDPNANYNYVPCLQPFDTANIKTLYKNIVNLTNNVNINVKNSNNWLKLIIYFGSAGAGNEVNSLRLTFEGESAVTIQEAVNLGYIEPLVLSGCMRGGPYYFENSFNLISGGSTGIGSYPSNNILIKPRNKKLVNITFNSAKTHPITQAKFEVQEFENFDISLSAAE